MPCSCVDWYHAVRDALPPQCWHRPLPWALACARLAAACKHADSKICLGDSGGGWGSALALKLALAWVLVRVRSAVCERWRCWPCLLPPPCTGWARGGHGNGDRGGCEATAWQRRSAPGAMPHTIILPLVALAGRCYDAHAGPHGSSVYRF